MNIWLLTSEYPPDFGGGIAAYCHHTAVMLSQRGHQLTVFDADENVHGRWEIEETTPQLRVVRFSANQSPQSSALGEFARWSYDAAVVLTDFCRQEGIPDVLEVQEYLGMPYFTLQRRLLLDDVFENLPVLVTAHTPLYLCRQFDRFQTYRFPGYWIGEMERFSMVAADEVVYPSYYLKNEVERSLPQVSKHSRVVGNPFEIQEESTSNRINPDRRGFLFTAKLERRKGIEPLLSTFSKLWNEGLEEPLYLIGDDWYDEQRQHWMSEGIHQRYEKYIDAKLLNWAGKQPPGAVIEKLSQVRAMVLPSLLENYPYAVLEAMAAGCPVVVSQSGGHREIVESGVSGLVFSHQVKGDLGEKIKAVLHFTPDQHASMAEAARLRVKQVSGYEVIAPQKEEALALACERMQPRSYFPFIRPLPRDYQPPVDRTLTVEKGMLSVVIPFFNLGNYLADTLESFSKLTDVSLETIVVDDGSTDQQSLDLLHSLQERYQFRLERTHNQGLPITRNVGAHLARGEFLAFLDADDCMDPLQYQNAIKVLRKYENVSFVGCWVEYFGDAQGYWPTWSAELPYALVHNPLNTGGLVYRRADFLHYGLNDPTFAFVMEDYESMLSMLEYGCRGVAIPEPYHKYRVRHDSMFHTTTDSSKIWIYQQLVQKHRNLYTACAEDIMGLISANGPGYLFDNPTLNYPTLGFTTETGSPSNGRLHDADFTQVPAASLFYYAFRAALIKPYVKLSGNIPWLKKVALVLKNKLGR